MTPPLTLSEIEALEKLESEGHIATCIDDAALGAWEDPLPALLLMARALLEIKAIKTDGVDADANHVLAVLNILDRFDEGEPNESLTL